MLCNFSNLAERTAYLIVNGINPKLVSVRVPIYANRVLFSNFAYVDRFKVLSIKDRFDTYHNEAAIIVNNLENLRREHLCIHYIVLLQTGCMTYSPFKFDKYNGLQVCPDPNIATYYSYCEVDE